MPPGSRGPNCVTESYENIPSLLHRREIWACPGEWGKKWLPCGKKFWKSSVHTPSIWNWSAQEKGIKNDENQKINFLSCERNCLKSSVPTPWFEIELFRRRGWKQWLSCEHFSEISSVSTPSIWNKYVQNFVFEPPPPHTFPKSAPSYGNISSLHYVDITSTV